MSYTNDYQKEINGLWERPSLPLPSEVASYSTHATYAILILSTKQNIIKTQI